MNIAIIGAGRLGRALGARLADAGHTIVFGGGESARAAAAAQPGARAASNADAASGADVVVLAVPFSNVRDALEQTGSLDGKLLWSCVNALKPDFSGLAIGFDTSAAEVVAAHAPGARVVAALPPFADAIAERRTEIDGLRPTSWVCGDDADACRQVANLLEAIGAEPAMAGPLVMSRLVEPAMMLLVAQAYSGEMPRRLALRLLEAGSPSRSRREAV